jgi:hypothetical protein
MTGRIGSNDDAVTYLRKVRPAMLDLTQMTRALEYRQAGADPDPLFGSRTSLPSQVDACVTLISRQAFVR